MSSLLIATQQANGRVAYSRFDTSLRAWEKRDKEVVAAAAIGSGHEDATVSVVKRTDEASPSLQAIGIFYETDNENVDGTLYRRAAYRESVDDGETWSAEQLVGHVGLPINDTPCRGIAVEGGRVLFHFANADSPFFGNIFCQTRAADGMLSVINTVFTGGGLSQVQLGRAVGDYCGFTGETIPAPEWAYRATFTVTSNPALLPSTQADFTLLVLVTDPALKTIANGGSVEHTTTVNGQLVPCDVVFKTTPGLSGAAMSYAITDYDAAAGTLEARVLVPSLSLGFTFYAGIGNASISTFQGGAVGAAYSSDVKLETPFPSAVALSDTLRDFSVNANNGANVNSPSATTGKIGTGLAYASAGSSYVNHSNPSSLQITGPITLKAWAKATDLTNAYRRVISKLGGSPLNGFEILKASSGDAQSNKFYFQCANAGALQVCYANAALVAGTWYRIIATYDGTTGKIYINGVLQTDDFTGASAIGAASVNLFTGNSPLAANYWNGVLDELGVETGAWSADRVTIEDSLRNG